MTSNIIKNDYAITGRTQNYCLQKASLVEEKLHFDAIDGFQQALQDGFFLMKIPSTIDVRSGIKLCHNFYKKKEDGPDKNYQGFQQHENIYFDREHFQTEHILLDAKARMQFLPDKVNQLADQMNALAINILKDVLRKLNAPQSTWGLATSNATENKGTHWFACSHYRPEKDKPGCATHQDTGFVTVLYIDQPGLEAYINNTWHSILPETGYFIVNFGRSFEILTSQLPTPVKSILHRVTQMTPKSNMPDRISMAAFTNSLSDANLYQFNHDFTLKFYQTVSDFLSEFNQTTWDDKHKDFGIKS